MFTASISRLFTELTGFHVQHLPAPPPGLSWDARRLIRACRGAAPSTGPLRAPVTCVRCAGRLLAIALRFGADGACLRGECRKQLFLRPVTDRRRVQGLLVMCGPTARAHGCHSRASADRRSPRQGRHRVSFRSARALLQLVVHSLEAAALERRAAAALASSRRVARLHDREERRLRDALRRAVPLIRREPARLTQEGACPRGVAGRLQERLLRDFVHPLTLAQLADDMHMNPSYLSTVFAREVGMPFKAYLTTLRMQHAQELLGNAACRIRDVAAAVGYSSPDRFRAAFRAWTSLAPSGWRRLMRVREADRPLEPGAALPARSRRAGSIVPCTALPAGV